MLTRRRVDDQIIQISPTHVTQKLPYHGIFLRTPPHHRIAFILEQKPDAHAREPRSARIGVYGHPPITALMDTAAVQPEHARD